MNQKGIPGTYALTGGPNAWKTAGYPIEGNNNSNTAK
jgi:rhodanese-related sulfurtransferase